MTGTHSTPTPRLADRLLTEVVRVREEAAGHPADVPQADAAGRQAGGALTRRILARAAALPDAAALQRAIRQVMSRGIAVMLLLVLLAGVAGAFAAATALDTGSPASLPLVLMLLVGSNLLMLTLWLMLLVVSPRVSPGLGRGVMALWSRLSGGAANRAADTHRAALAILGGGASGRWLAASLSHAAWLSFALTGWLSLLLLLSVRAYALSWDTTLLAPTTVAEWVRALSFAPAALGVPVDALFVDEGGRTVAGQAGAQWLLAAVLIYGVAPRLLALLICGGLWWRAQARFGRDLQHSGFARLRSRLMPDHQPLGVVDQATALPQQTPAVRSAARLPTGAVLGLRLDDAGDHPPPSIPGIQWQWLGATDTAVARQSAVAAVTEQPRRPVVVLARATMSPDRGAERFIVALAEAAHAPVYLLLVGVDRLAARGADHCAQRLEDWQALAQRAGIHNQPLRWP